MKLTEAEERKYADWQTVYAEEVERTAHWNSERNGTQQPRKRTHIDIELGGQG